MTSQVISRSILFGELIRSKTAICGMIILGALIIMTLYAVLGIPLESFRQWNNPSFWIDYPKGAGPAWTNLGIFGPTKAEHIILTKDDASIPKNLFNGVRIVTYSYHIDFNHDRNPATS